MRAGAGRVSPRRLKPGRLAPVWRDHSISPSITASAPSPPVGGEGGQVVARASVVLDLWIAVLVREIEPVAEALVDARPPAEVHRSADAATVADAQADPAQRLRGRPLDDVVDEAARGARTGLDAAGALEELDAFLVGQRQDGLAADRQALAAVVEALVEHEAAHAEVVPVAGRVVGVGDGGVEAGQVRQAARAGPRRSARDRRRWPARAGPRAAGRRNRRCPECGPVRVPSPSPAAGRGQPPRRRQRARALRRPGPGSGPASTRPGRRPATSGCACAARREEDRKYGMPSCVQCDGRSAVAGPRAWSFDMLPCARITSIRFKGTFSVEPAAGLGLRCRVNTPSVCRAAWPNDGRIIGRNEQGPPKRALRRQG